MRPIDFDFSRIVGFDWDSGNLDHIKKHAVDANECQEVFYNQPLLTRPDAGHSRGEQRFQVLGQTDRHRELFVACTVRGQQIRVISARDQNKKERAAYYKLGGQHD